MMEFVSWDDDIQNIWKVIKFHGSKPLRRINRGFSVAMFDYCKVPTTAGPCGPPVKSIAFSWGSHNSNNLFIILTTIGTIVFMG